MASGVGSLFGRFIGNEATVFMHVFIFMAFIGIIFICLANHQKVLFSGAQEFCGGTVLLR